MCIRALDYLPPVDVRFGELLRAIITADTDLVPDDPHNYRIAFAEAFRGRGILVEDCLSMSPENLLWETPKQMFGSMEDAYDAGRGAFEYWRAKMRRATSSTSLAQSSAGQSAKKIDRGPVSHGLLTSGIYSRR